MRLQSLADKEREARISAIRGAAKFAARTVAAEIDLRWMILEREAVDPAPRRLLADMRQEADPIQSPACAELQRWIEERYADHLGTTKATSWFITDDRGTQIARHPLNERTRGSRYAFRDYFHGRGVDLKPEESDGVPPLRTVHRSIVFVSQATGNLMTAFSVPIRKDGAVIGVLAMTVELGRFGELDLRFSDEGVDRMAVLIDTKRDASGEPGLILHHPLLDPAMQAPYLGSDRTAALLRLRNELRSGPNGESLPESFDDDYQDPVGRGDDGDAWLAAFEPVFVRGRPDSIRDTGWIVVMQERLR